MTEQRYKAVQGVLAEGRTVSEVASDWGVSRRTMHRWLARYEGEGLEGGAITPVQEAADGSVDPPPSGVRFDCSRGGGGRHAVRCVHHSDVPSRPNSVLEPLGDESPGPCRGSVCLVRGIVLVVLTIPTVLDVTYVDSFKRRA